MSIALHLKKYIVPEQFHFLVHFLSTNNETIQHEQRWIHSWSLYGDWKTLSVSLLYVYAINTSDLIDCAI